MLLLLMMRLLTLALMLWDFPPAQTYKLVDLTHPLNKNNMFWPGLPGFQRKVVFNGSIARNTWVEVGSYSAGEHGGTHVDSPRHFVKNGIDFKDFPLERTVAEGVHIDCSAEAAENYDYALTVKKLMEWESQHGPIPDEAAVLVNFGYSTKFRNPKLFVNSDVLDDAKKFHFPYLGMDAVKWLIDKRKLKMIGTDTPSPDAPSHPNFPVHNLVLHKNIMIMENLNIPKTLPARYFRLHAAPIRMEGGTGVQTRIFAMLYEVVMEMSRDGSEGLFIHSSWLLVVGISIALALAKAKKNF